ncbi:molybdopterin-guanine dinucleotide biosynthesis protein MobB, partial [Photobacterium damselae]
TTGFREEEFPKIEIHRPNYGKPLLYPNDPNIIAFATDDETGLEKELPRLDINNPSEVARFILDWLQQQ